MKKINIFKYIFRKDADDLIQRELEINSQPNRLPEYIFGEESIDIGDRFMGYACSVLFQEQICSGFTKEGLIYGTTTLAVFRLKNIKKY